MTKIINNAVLASLLAASTAAFASTNEATRIVGGEQSTAVQWPSIVSIKSASSASHFCGASLIAPQWVLTAAHCLFESNGEETLASDIIVTVGEYDLTSSPATPSTNVEQIFTHSEYNAVNSVNDIALIKLTEAVNTPTISPVDISDTTYFVDQGEEVTVMGWGSTVAYAPDQTIDPSYPGILRQVTLPLNTDQQCSSSLGSNYTSEMICAGFPQGGADSCQGDSGGPLVIKTSAGWQQIGVVSWGFGCASAGNPGVYTRLALYADWIDNITQKASITTNTHFAYTAVNTQEIKQLTVNNGSNSSATFNYTLTGSGFFSLDTTKCLTIIANSSCQFPVTYAPTNSQTHSAAIVVTSDIGNSTAMTANLSAKPLVDASSQLDLVGLTVANSEWATDGDNSWVANSANTALQSGVISDNQQSVLMATITGKGHLKFDWASSSEKDYDLLVLNINGTDIKEISGNNSFSTKNIYLDDTVNKVLWIYKKDGDISYLNDQALLRNISFEVMTKAEYELQLIDDSVDDIVDEILDDIVDDAVSSKSSGSIGFMIFLLTPLIFIRCYYSSKFR